MSLSSILRFSRSLTRVSTSAALLALTLLSPGCTAREHRATQARTARSPESQPWTDMAMFLGGLPGRPDGPFHALEQTETWKSYSTEFNTSWNRLESEQLRAIETYQKRELAPIQPRGDYVLYPFSGPDILYVSKFFPEGKTIVMAGLEPVGNLRSTDRFKPETLDRELSGWKKSISTVFERSFFVTREMDSEFHGRVADGLLPMLLILLERTGHSVDGVEYGELSDQGEFVSERSAGAPVTKHKGVRVRYHRGDEELVRTVYYFKTDLAAAFERNPGFSRFLDRMGTPDTMVKSASFLLHWRMCRGMRSYILAKSNLVLQDDTGVPYSYFQNPNWKVQLYGQYSAPVKPFRREYQKDLAAAFQEPDKVKPLGFSLGYGYGLRPSSMILAVHTKPLTQTATRK